MRIVHIVYASLILLVVLVVAYFTLDMWAVELPIDKPMLKRIVLTTLIADGLLCFLLIALPPLFARRQPRDYDEHSGNVAQRKR